ncbi:hypothetical protein WN50_33475 [Limnoraphis robusta CS-951]|uniref:Uncharacterized protein n=1 Tax=Limnoraphis robusta CS-951 TaxID=1637645 RepID=A0A0J9EXI0_9CYAN|nr:hypothetical protein WN50_33475 [Limnoraphis robusta CS-951]
MQVIFLTIFFIKRVLIYKKISLEYLQDSLTYASNIFNQFIHKIFIDPRNKLGLSVLKKKRGNLVRLPH